MSKLFLVLPAALLIVFTIFFSGPSVIYNGNSNEFTNSLISLFQFYLLPALLILLILITISQVLNKKIFTFYQTFLSSIAILLWTQANLFVWSYGTFNGKPIDWSANAHFGFFEIFIWLAFIFSCFKFKDKISSALRTTCTLLLAIQFIVILISVPQIWQNYKTPFKNKKESPTYSFSKKNNVIQIVLDTIQSDILQDVIAKDPEYYSKKLDGFTFYTNTTSSFCGTHMSVPSFLSGSAYENHQNMASYLESTFNGNTIINFLADHGYSTDVFHGYYLYPPGKSTSNQKLTVPYKAGLGGNFESLRLFNYSLFRHSPHFIKKLIYNNQNWRFSNILKNPSDYTTFFAHGSFLADITNNMTVDHDQPTYKFIHVLTSHFPIEVDSNCKLSKVLLPKRENATDLFRCSLEGVFALFDSLKENGIYDSSAIILHSDHGAGIKVNLTGWDSKNIERFKDRTIMEPVNEDIIGDVLAGSANAILFVKPPNSKGDLKFSKAPAELTDIPSTIQDLIGIAGKNNFPGTPINKLTEDKNRKRLFKYFNWDSNTYREPFFTQLDEYVIEGPVLDRSSWKKGRTLGRSK